jgi:hypothetical protein
VAIILVAVASGFARIGKHAFDFAIGVAERLTEAPMNLADVFDGVLGQRTIGGDGEFPPFCISRRGHGTSGVELDCGFDVHCLEISGLID